MRRAADRAEGSTRAVGLYQHISLKIPEDASAVKAQCAKAQCPRGESDQTSAGWCGSSSGSGFE